MTPVERRATTVRLSVEQMRWVREQAFERRMTQQQIIERALMRAGAPWPRDLRTRYNELIYLGQTVPGDVHELLIGASIALRDCSADTWQDGKTSDQVLLELGGYAAATSIVHPDDPLGRS